jgi:hypothetical protein
MKNKFVSLVAAVSMGAAFSAQSALTFDPDGPGPLGAISNVGSFDWAPTTFLALGGVDAITAFNSSAGTCPAGSCDFDVLVSATMVGIFDTNANNVTPAGLGTTFEITMVARLSETVVSSTLIPGLSDTAQFLSRDSNTDFLEVYYEAGVDTVDIDGSGFNDGTLILSGDLVQANVLGNFTVNILAGVVTLDQSPNGNDYGPQSTVVGTGSQGNIPVDNLTQNNAWFLTQLDMFGIEFANISTALPFNSVDPADCFTPTAGAGGLPCVPDHVANTAMAGQIAANGGILPNIGPINGFGPGLGGPDFIAQTDFNSPVAATAVPEPGSIAMLGIGLSMLGFAALRRRKHSKTAAS